MDGKELLENWKMRMDALIQMESSAEKEKKDGQSRTVCAFPFRGKECAKCMYYDLCSERVHAAEEKSFRMGMEALRSYVRMEKEIREAIPKEEETEIQNSMKAALAGVLRREALNRTVFSDDTSKRIEEAFSIYQDLYYATGNPSYRDEAESCRHLLDRID